MSDRFVPPITQLVNDDASSIASGWKLDFFVTGGISSRKDTFSDNARTSTNANPVVADSSGRFGDIFLESGTYRVRLLDDNDVEKWTADPVAGSVGASGNVDSKTAAYTVTSDDATKVISADVSSGAFTVTLLAAATAGDGFEVTVHKSDTSANAVTVDGNASETISGATTFLLDVQHAWITIRCDGSNWLVVARGHNHPGVNRFGGQIQETEGGVIASGSPLVIDTDGNHFHVSGTTSFSAMTVTAGMRFTLEFDAALTMTHSATLDLPEQAADITTRAGDRAFCWAQGANDVIVLAYVRSKSVFRTTSASVAVDTTHTFAHGLGALPDIITIGLTCTADDAGFIASTNDTIYTTTMKGATGDHGMTVWADATNVYATIGLQYTPVNPDDFNDGNLDLTKWDFRITAVLF